jgi:hypothetical protein
MQNDGGEEWHGANLQIVFGKVPNAQRLFGECAHRTLAQVDPEESRAGTGPRQLLGVWAGTAGATRA